MVLNKGLMMMCMLLLAMGAVACGGQGDQSGAGSSSAASAELQKASSKDEPANLVVFGNPGDPENVFNDRIGDAVRKKFPNYTIEYLQKNKDNKMQNLIASGSQVDLVYDSVGGAPESIIQTGSQFDISELAKKHQIDLSRFDPPQLQAVTQFGGLYGLPIQTGGLVLYYNKDIFDKFGVAYPKNGMTWDEAIDLGNRLTRNVDGTQYIGLGLSVTHAILMNSYSLPYVDQKTGKALLDSDKFKKLVDTLIVKPTKANGYKEKIASLKRSFNNNDFMKEKTMAMFVMNYGLQDQKDFETFNWDMASLPVFPDQPQIGSQPYPAILFVTNTSKFKDQAVEVLKFLTSDEYQMDLSKRGFVPVLKDEQIKKAFAQNTGFKDKNVMNAIFYNRFAPAAPKTQYDSIASKALNKKVMDLIMGGTDVNTALRTAEEEANKGIAGEKG